ncbi:hypothetical protein BDW62DRAFT_180072 [Aspergillus aurantiobrunneus]
MARVLPTEPPERNSLLTLRLFLDLLIRCRLHYSSPPPAARKQSPPNHPLPCQSNPSPSRQGGSVTHCNAFTSW